MNSFHAHRLVEITEKKMELSPIAIYKFNEMPIKIMAQLFTKLEKIIFNFLWKNKNWQMANIILYHIRTSRSITFVDFKHYYRIILINKCIALTQKQVYQLNRMEDTVVNPHT